MIKKKKIKEQKELIKCIEEGKLDEWLNKKNYKSKWSIKNLNEKPRYKDDCGIKINNPINAKQKYINTFLDLYGSKLFFSFSLIELSLLCSSLILFSVFL